MRVLLLLAAIAVPILATAQPAKIGVLTFEETPEALKQALRSGLREQGYTEGKNITLEWREAGGKVERANQLAAELVSMKVDVIVASLTPAVTAAKKATSTIPIVMAPAADPVATGFVKSLAHPGGNITGITNVVTDVGSKLLGLIRELKPNVSRVAVLMDVRSQLAKPFLEEMQAAASKSRMHIVPVEMKGPGDTKEAFNALRKEKVQAIVVQPLLATKELAELAREHKMIAISTGVASSSFPRLGAALGYGSDPREHYQRAAVYIAKILKGAKPGDLPVEQPTTFELVINMKTAKALGISVPKDMLVRANEVIE